MLLRVECPGDPCTTPRTYVFRCDQCNQVHRHEEDWAQPRPAVPISCECGASINWDGSTNRAQPLPDDSQQPDTLPGNYYVSAVDSPRYALLAGPFPNDHAGALALVEQARQAAYDADPRAPWFSYGTCRMPQDFTRPGAVNAQLGLSVPA